jgi:20S proteasome alpha/beta subunit
MLRDTRLGSNPRRRIQTASEPKRRRPVTVCAAAICTMQLPGKPQEQVLLGISDRMLTSGGVEFEPRTSKIYPFTLGQQPAKIACLSADDTDLGFDLARQTHQELLKLTGEVSVRQAAYSYAQQFMRLRRERAECRHLAHLGLTTESFIAQQRRMRREDVADIKNKLKKSELQVQSLIVGVDKDGAHIYHIYDPGECLCRDRSAFWAIGLGQTQFETQFTSLNYDRDWSIQDAMLLVYTAKKKAERAPAVGPATDMFYIREMTGYRSAKLVNLRAIDEHYQDFEAKVAGFRKDAVLKMLEDSRLFSDETIITELPTNNKLLHANLKSEA